MNLSRKAMVYSAILQTAIHTADHAEAGGVGPVETYDAVKALINARQLGLYIQGQERTFSEGISAYCTRDFSKAHDVLEQTLFHKSTDGRGSPFPGQTYPTASVTGMPSAV